MTAPVDGVLSVTSALFAPRAGPIRHPPSILPKHPGRLDRAKLEQKVEAVDDRVLERDGAPECVLSICLDDCLETSARVTRPLPSSLKFSAASV